MFQMSTVFKEQVVPSWSRGGSTPSTPSSPYVGMPYSLNKSKNNSSSNLQVSSCFLHCEYGLKYFHVKIHILFS